MKRMDDEVYFSILEWKNSINKFADGGHVMIFVLCMSIMNEKG